MAAIDSLPSKTLIIRNFWIIYELRLNIHANTATNRIEVVNLVAQLRRVILAMRLNLFQCAFKRKEVEALGHKVAQNGILPYDGHVSSSRDLTELASRDELMRFWVFGIVSVVVFITTLVSLGHWILY